MKKILGVFLLLFFAISSFSQYYFNDIIAPQAAAKQYVLLKKNGIRQVNASSHASDNQPNTNFVVRQHISADAKQITTNTFSTVGADIVELSATISYYEKDQLVKTVDSTANLSTITQYAYYADGKIQAISTASTDASRQNQLEENHEWLYNDKGKPMRMLKIKDKKDTTHVVEFALDETGNVIEEIWKRKNYPSEHYYYYYNSKNELTDIVRFNNKVRKLLPDFLYEYDDKGRVAKMIQIPVNSSDYLIWQYKYNELGLKVQEICLSKQNEPIGLIEYSYQ